MNPNEDPTVQDPSLDKGVLSSAQVPGSPNHSSPFASVIPASVQLTTDIYIASKPKPVQELFKLTGSQGPRGPEQRYIGGLALASQGFVVDPWCDLFPNDPVVTMILRSNMNIVEVDSVGFVGRIKTSLNPKDYPAFYPVEPPPPPAPGQAQTVVGNATGIIPPGVFDYLPNGGQLFGAGPLAFHAAGAGLIVNGGQVSEGGKVYRVQISFGLMGETISFSIPF